MLKDFKGDARGLFGEGGLPETTGKRAIEAALEGEMTHHLGPNTATVLLSLLPRTLHRCRNAVDAQEERLAQRILRFLLLGGPVHDVGAVKCSGPWKASSRHRSKYGETAQGNCGMLECYS